MKNLLYLCLFIATLSACDNKKGAVSGKSDLIVKQTDDKEKTENNDSNSLTNNNLDTTQAEVKYELKRQEVQQTAEEKLATRPEKQVRVSGTIIGGEGMSITLDKLGGRNNMEPIKTTIINEDGYFELDAMSNEEQIYDLRTDSGNIVLFLGPGNYDVKANIHKLNDFQVNAPMSYKVRDFFLILEDFNARNEKINKREERYTKQKKAWKVQRILDSLPIYNKMIEEDRAKAIIDFVNNNRNSPFAAEAANRLDYLRHTKFLEDLYEELNAKFPYSSYVKNLGVRLVRYRPLAEGKAAHELVMPDKEGTNYRLSSLKGKYVLVYFTISYSDRCIKQARELKSIYNKYKAKGFEIYNVNLDETYEDWQIYLDNAQPNWIVVSDMLGQKSTAFDYYMAPDVPMTYLIDPQGKIAAKFLEPADLEKILSQKLH